MLLISVVVVGILYLNYENYLNRQLEQAILTGYPGTQSAQVQLKIDSVLEGLGGEIDGCRLEILDWHLGEWQIQSFEGDFRGIRINMGQLLSQQVLVVEEVQRGDVLITLNEANLQTMVESYFPGAEVSVLEDRLELAVAMELMGTVVDGVVRGYLTIQNGSLAFVPERLRVAGFNLPSVIEQQLLQKLHIKVPMEEMPFPFRLTTVNIVQGKIIVRGGI